ncbi:hypothetical protein PG987_016107 [Apiospora arundinis]
MPQPGPAANGSSRPRDPFRRPYTGAVAKGPDTSGSAHDESNRTQARHILSTITIYGGEYDLGNEWVAQNVSAERLTYPLFVKPLIFGTIDE